jgi:class 3 adenylate cyclase
VQIDLSTESCKRFLRRRVNQKIGVVILYVDIDGSTKMSRSLPPDKFATILHIFSQEMSLVIAEYDSGRASKNAVDCAKSMQEIIKKCINPELNTHGLPEIRVKMSIDHGDVQVVLYGKSIERSHIDIVGSSISIAAKMIPLAQTWQVVVGQSVYEKLANKDDFAEIKVDPSRWTYIDEKRGSSYRLYALR